MIKAYNETGVNNLESQSVLSEWHDKKLLSDEQFCSGNKLFPVPFYQPNVFIKVGLFIFTVIVILASFAFLSIFVFDGFMTESVGYAYVCLFYAIILFLLAELFIKKNRLYRSGTDNALLYLSFNYLLAFVLMITDFNYEVWVYCLLTTLLLLPAILRYGDPLLSIIAYANLIAACFLFVTKTDFGKAIVPFTIMALSALIYFAISWWRKKETKGYYTDCQEIILTFALLTFYLGGNYAVVREGNALLHDLPESKQVDFSLLFYLFTALIPILFLFYGILKRQRRAVIIGLISAVISVITFLYYFSTFPGEWESTIIGAVVVVAAVLIIRYLKTPKSGITSEPDNSQNPRNLEALLISQIAQQSPEESDGISNGGNFGGGGAGSGY